MHLVNFDIFARTISNLPGKAILKTLGLDNESLDHASENYRLFLPADAYSIFCFRQFVREMIAGKSVTICGPLPLAHVRFYRQTVMRLVGANEMDPSALHKFDNAFSSAVTS
ncbi:MAG: hypothetical protein ACREE6_09235 [Limisphaerales bacterium]